MSTGSFNSEAHLALIMALLSGKRRPRPPLTPEQQLEAEKRAERALWNKQIEAKKAAKKGSK